MSVLYTKMLVIAMWCGTPSAVTHLHSTQEVDQCRVRVQQCLQGKTTHLQAESCFMGEKLAK